MAEIGIDFLTEFLDEKYLKEFIAAGGSKMKFITGRPGSGKSFLLNDLSKRASGDGYVTVSFSAKDVWLHDFREIYLEILRQCDFEELLRGCAQSIVREMGFEDYTVGTQNTFMDYLSGIGSADPLTKREIRNQLRTLIQDNPHMDNNFAYTISLLVGDILGHPALEEQDKTLLTGWLNGDKTIKLSLLRALGLAPMRITKFNARHMLRSLAEMAHIAGRPGIFVAVDDLDILINRSSLEAIRYTKMRREDTYESIRQMIDEIDTMHYMMFVFAFDRALIDNENFGLKSYQALWMRIQNEVVGQRFNRFADIIDMDRLAKQIYTPQLMIELSEAFVRRQEAGSAAVLTEDQVRDCLSRFAVSNVGLPAMIREWTFRREEGSAEYV